MVFGSSASGSGNRIAHSDVYNPCSRDAEDARLGSAEAMLERIDQYVGSAGPPAVSARAMLQVLYDSVEDRREKWTCFRRRKRSAGCSIRRSPVNS